MHNTFYELATAAIGGVIIFVIIKAVMSAQNTTGWSALEVSVTQTIIPLLALVTVVFLIMWVWGKAGKG